MNRSILWLEESMRDFRQDHIPSSRREHYYWSLVETAAADALGFDVFVRSTARTRASKPRIEPLEFVGRFHDAEGNKLSLLKRASTG